MSSTQQLLLGEGAGGSIPVYIEEVFSTYLYTGNGSTQTITNGIDLSTKGGLVWIKRRNDAYSNVLYDTSRGVNLSLSSNTTAAQANQAPDGVSAFNTTGFSLNGNSHLDNNTTGTYASWTFREQPKFFDVVTYTGNATAGRTVAHNLGSAPGCIIIKSTDNVSVWYVYHRSVGNTGILQLQDTAATATSSTYWNNTDPTSSVFTLGGGGINASGATYVAYLFAHDAGGFGLTGSDNVISCGSYTGIAYPTSLEVTLGYEPQFVIIKNATTVSGWAMWDVMRGMEVVPAANTAQAKLLEPNTSAAESSQPGIFPTATGFVVKNGLTSISGSGDTMVYIAIRRGPMKVPTLGTTVFSPALGSGTAPGYVSGFPVDLGIERNKGSAANTEAGSRLTGATVLQTNSTAAEANSTNTKFDYMNGFFAGTKGTNEIAWMFRRAPSFFDEVCYAGTSTNRYEQHSLTVVPELIFVKCRNSASTGWITYSAATGPTKYMKLNTTDAATTDSTFWNDLSPTSTTFSLGTSAEVNSNSVNQTYVAYLFATCPGVSKVGSFTGTGLLQTIDCGFTAGSRFVLIKRTSAAGEWYVWDSARGISSGNDPYLQLQSDAAEVTGTNFVDTTSVGFQVTAAATGTVNISGQSYIFLAIA